MAAANPAFCGEKSPEKLMDSDKRGEKRSVEKLQEGEQGKDENVHSANAWEQANLGDDDRKQKFLRLMGAGKKQHSGRFVIGDTKTVHTKAVDSEKKVREIEEQYNEGMEHKLVSPRHAGLGFHDVGASVGKTTDSVSNPDNEKTKTIDEKKDSKEDGQVGSTEIAKKESEKESVSEKDEKLAGIKKLSFVKGSS
ncbi:small acidic protein-like [Lineus longissimus]|uniref:small acidic protein-like n=1 Tax=Lineus longissimus TaxID=88925 RepID=UPI002B4C478F